MFNVGLSKSNNIHLTFFLYLLAYFFLALVGINFFANYNLLEDRFNDISIFITHLFTIGFLSSIFTGSLFQLLPVLFGIELKTNLLFAVSFATSICLSLLSFYLGLMNNQFAANLILIIPFSLLILHWFYLLKSSCLSFYKNSNKTLKDYHLILCLIHLVIGTIIGLMMILGHMQILNFNFRPVFTDTHVFILFIGFLMSLIYLIAKNVLPMFFVSNTQHNYHWGLFLFYLFFYLKIFFDLNHLEVYSKIALNILELIIFWGVIDLLKTLISRKRKRKNPVINIWYLSLILLIAIFVINQTSQINFDENFQLKKLMFILIKIFISSMFVKIVPFLYWLNLSNQQLEKMNFNFSLPTVNDFISELEMKIILSFQILTVIFTILNTKWLGIIILIEALYFIYLLNKTRLLFNKISNKIEN